MAMRAPSSPGCGVMHIAPTSAVSRACRTSAGAAVIGRGPNSSNSKPVYCAPRSSIAAAMLAATERLVSSAMRATCSPGRTPRQVSTAFFAPGINSGSGWPKYISQFYKNSRKFEEAFIKLDTFMERGASRIYFLPNGLCGAWADAEGGDLAAAAGDVGEA